MKNALAFTSIGMRRKKLLRDWIPKDARSVDELPEDGALWEIDVSTISELDEKKPNK